jgi:hypothetical protein
MLRRMNTKDAQFSVAAYAKRARSGLYRSPRDTRPLTTLDAFSEAYRLFPEAAVGWVSKLRRLEDKHIRAIVEHVPGTFISPVARDFAVQVVAENARRLDRIVEMVK